MTTSASAPGKIILFGEHAVVYGQPALAVPISTLKATATIEDGAVGTGLLIRALNLNTEFSLATAANESLTMISRLVLQHLSATEPDAVISVDSTIPVASGLGSGAAVAAATGRALANYLGHPLTDDELSSLVYEVEKTHHGTPSGIDNTVVCYNKPVYFIRNKTLDTFHPLAPFHILIGDTGIPSPTRITVGAVRAAWEQDRSLYEQHFADIGRIADQARNAIEVGKIAELGSLMNENQLLLEKIGVSSPELNRLIEAARSAGARGAKLSGGGGGGNMIALIDPQEQEKVTQALQDAGAVRVIHTVIE